MFTKLFVGGLPFKYSDGELRALLSPAGHIVSATMVPDPSRGRTRGFGFVEMSTPEEAQAAIAQLNGTKVAEKAIFVTQARERAVGSAPRSFKAPFQRKAYKDARSARPPRPDGPPRGYQGKRPFDRSSRPGNFGDAPGGFRRSENSTFGQKNGEGRRAGGGPSGPSRGYQGKRPFDRNRTPGSFGAPPGGFKRPENSPYGQPSSENRRSFSPPRHPKGDFGPSRRGPKGPDSRGPGKPASRPPQKSFWNKFDKKKPREDF